MRILTEEMMREEENPESLFYYITHTPPSDHTEMNRLAAEFEEEMKIEHKKWRKMIREARERGEI